MTTAWAHSVRGQFVAAAAANAGGPLLALAAMIAGPWALASAIRGRPLWAWPDQRWLAAGGVAIAALVMADWLRRLLSG
jgi:hypothetical protein